MDPITIDARWNVEAGVWTGTSHQVHGLVIEAQTWPDLIQETRLVLPNLLALNGHGEGPISVTFRAEEQLKLEPA